MKVAERGPSLRGLLVNPERGPRSATCHTSKLYTSLASGRVKTTCQGFQWESEAPAELAPPWFGRSLTLPVNEFVAHGRTDDVYRGGLSQPV